MVSVICQCRNSWMHESPDVSPSSSFNPCRGPMLQLLQARPRGFHFDFPSIPSQGRKGRRSLSKVQIALVRKDFVPFFLIFLRRRSIVINTHLNPPPPWMQSSIALRPRKGNLPFFPFLYKFSNTLFHSAENFVTVPYSIFISQYPGT